MSHIKTRKMKTILFFKKQYKAEDEKKKYIVEKKHTNIAELRNI
jgi:hypothetical protein